MKNTMKKQSPAKMLGSKAKEAIKAAVAAKKAKGTTKPVEGKPSSKPATKSVTKEMIGGGGVPQLRKHKR